MWARRNQNRKARSCQKRRCQHNVLLWRKSPIWPATLSGLGGGKPSSYGKDNHSAKCCQSTKRNRTHGVREEYEESSSDAGDINEESSSESDYIDCVTSTPDSISTVEHRESAQEIYAEMILKGKAIRFQVDSEATVNVLPAKYVGHEIYPTKKFLQMWNRSELKHEGVTRVKIRNPRNDKKYSVSSSL